MLRPAKDGPSDIALCTCDACNNTITKPARVGRRKRPNVPDSAPIENEGMIIKCLQKDGWSYIGKKLRCPKCEAERAIKIKPVEEAPMTTTTEPVRTNDVRQPTKAQKREIIDLLTEVYDTKAQRYKGVETDQSVADAIGADIMWGWVSQLRDDLFGPDGNEAEDKAIAELKEWQAKADKAAAEYSKQLQDLQASLREFNNARNEVTKLMNAIKKRG